MDKKTDRKIQPMFTVDINGKSYSVMFERDKRPTRRGTFCFIYRTDGTRPGQDGEPEYTGQAFPSMTICNPKDNFDKNKGRKWALKYALKHRGFNREERTKFWQAYFAARGKVN